MGGGASKKENAVQSSQAGAAQSVGEAGRSVPAPSVLKSEFDALKTSLQGENQRLQVEIQALKSELEATRTAQRQSAGQGGNEMTASTKNQEPPKEITASNLGASSGGNRSVAELRKMLVDDSDAKFAQMTADGSDEVTYEGVRTFLGIPANADDTELKQLFAELDVDGSGKITKQEFLDGLKATQPLKGSQATFSLLRSLGMVDIVSKHITDAFQRHFMLSADAEIDMQMILDKATPELIAQAWDRSKEDVVRKGQEKLQAMAQDRERAVGAREFNEKFASNAETMEFTYKGLPEFLEGVAGALGLASNNIYEGMKIEFCHSLDAKTPFRTSNYGGIQSTPQLEYAFVVDPDMTKEYPGGRKGIPLKYLLLAASAKAANSETRMDTGLEELDERTRGAVKAVLLRRAKEAGLSKEGLKAAAAADGRLRRLASLSKTRLRALKEELSAAFKDAAPQPATGLPAFADLASQLVRKEALLAEEVEALVETARRVLQSAGLTEEEVIALRLYTGPAFVKLNGTLRGFEVGRNGNTYVNTIHAAISGMVKVAGVSPIPDDRLVYRGQSGMRLPRCFWEGNEQGMKGGVELAFLSTTTDLEVATQYVGSKTIPMVFAIQVGAVDKGAALGFLSQFPNEEECLMPPRSFLEVVDEPSLLQTAKGPVLLFPVKINCNLQTPTIEKSRESRRALLVSTMQQGVKELSRDLDEAMQTEEVKTRIQLDHFWEDEEFDLIKSIKDESVAALVAKQRKPATWFNVDINFHRAMIEALGLRRLCMGRLRYWMEDTSVYVESVCDMNAYDVDREASGRLMRLIDAAQEAVNETGSDEARDELRALALSLCKHKELVRESVDEILNDAHETALMVEASKGNSQNVCSLLDAAADPNASRKDGCSALHLAAQSGYSDTVLKLVRRGAEVDKTDEYGTTAFFLAAQNGHTNTLRVLVKDCKANPKIPNISSQPPLRNTCFAGFLRTAQYLVQECGVEVDERDDDADTPFLMAAQNGHLELMKWLAKEGDADIHACDDTGMNAVAKASANGHVSLVEWLVEQGVDGERRDQEGETPLMCACGSGKKEVAAVLVKISNADVSAVNNTGATAVLLAAEGGYFDVVEWLIKDIGADPTVRDEAGNTGAILAAKKGSAAVVKLFVQEGKTNVDGTNDNGDSALTMAAAGGYADIVHWLVKDGKCDVAVVNVDGDTAVTRAARNGHAGLAEWLVVEGGADAKARDGTGLTLLDYLAGSDPSQVSVPFVQSVLEKTTAEELAAVVGKKRKKGEKEQGGDSEEGATLADEEAGKEATEGVEDENEGGQEEAVEEEEEGEEEDEGVEQEEDQEDQEEDDEEEDEEGGLKWTAAHCAVYAGNTAIAKLVLAKQNSENEVKPALAKIQAEIARIDQNDLVLFRGSPLLAPINIEKRTVRFRHKSSVRFARGCCAGFKAYFEVLILKPPTDGPLRVGFVTAQSKASRYGCSEAIGDDHESWAVDGSDTPGAWHGGATSGYGTPYETSWARRDVVGVAVDLTTANRQMHLAVNGEWERGVFTSIGDHVTELFPVICAGGGAVVEFNFGESEFKFTQASEGFLPLCRARPSGE